MLSDMQRPLLMGATFPVPLDSDCVEAAVEELRASEGEAAFPWAGRPWN